jgi:predicted RNase H-like nuclease (RuvC/YqgF family)
MQKEVQPLITVMNQLDELENKVHALLAHNQSLKSRISELQAELRVSHARIDQLKMSSDAMNGVSDNDRLALKQQIGSYIGRIDQILGNS